MVWSKTAIVHEWLVNYAGSERVVESFTNIWKDADVFTLVDFLDDEQRNVILKGKKANTTFIQKLPLARKKHRYYLPLFPAAIERFNLSHYKLIISSAHAVSKGVRTNKNQLHICYCHSPMRYAWDQSDQYLTGAKGFIAKSFMNYLRNWDLKSAENVNFFIANSNHIAEKIKRIYKRDSVVIYPPVDVDKFEVSEIREDYYVTASRLVPYKKTDLIVEAFNQMPDKKLFVIGSGPEKEKLKTLAGANIEFLGYQPEEQLKQYLKRAKAFVFAAEEDFGIIVVEAMACGTPVIALNKGGTAESVLNNKTGIHFSEQTPDSIKEAIIKFEKSIENFDPQFIRKHAEKFNRKTFEDKIIKFVTDKLENFQK
ncbi:MAG: glycosyltransferase family 4 protein [Ignavibacteriaceae bacterium]|nr:glycosyltransferase family 4 protein [Ignavibacteriaceae bacterium]